MGACGGSLSLRLAILLAGCGAVANGEPGSGTVRVVAAENFWGSIASQLGGDRATCGSIITNPATTRTPTSRPPSDARSSRARSSRSYNGVGYDPWAPSCSPQTRSPDERADRRRPVRARGRRQPAPLVSPADVEAVTNAITAATCEARPKATRPTSERRRRRSRTRSSRSINRADRGHQAPVRRRTGRRLGEHLRAAGAGARPEAPDHALSFLKAISEGTEASAQDKTTVERQLGPRGQGLGLQLAERTPEIQRLNALARAERIPIATITETLSPADASFEQWQWRSCSASRGLAPGDRAMSVVELRGAGVRLGGRQVFDDVDLTVARRRVPRRARPQRRRQVDADASDPRARPARRRQRHRARRHVRPAHDHGSDTCRSEAALTAPPGCAESTWSGLESTARVGACRSHCPPQLGSVAAANASAQTVIEMVGAAPYARRAIGELSGGEQQRLLIAQALARSPQLLILDEPLDSLDLPNQIAVAALIRRIATEERISVMLVAHDVNPLLGYLDRVVYMGSGRALTGTVDEVITPTKLTALYGSPVEVLRTNDGRLVVVGLPEAPHHHGHRHEEP